MDYFQFYGVEIPTRCFVGGLPYSMTELEMNNFFSQFGSVKDSKIITDRNGVSKGYGFVTFETEREAAGVCAQGSLYYKEKKLNISKAIRRQGGQYSKANQEYVNGLMLYQTVDGQLLSSKNGSWVVEERNQYCQPSKPCIQPVSTQPLWPPGPTPYVQTSPFYPVMTPQPILPFELLPQPSDPGPLLYNYDHAEVTIQPHPPPPPPPLQSLVSLPLHHHPPHPPPLPHQPPVFHGSQTDYCSPPIPKITALRGTPAMSDPLRHSGLKEQEDTVVENEKEEKKEEKEAEEGKEAELSELNTLSSLVTTTTTSTSLATEEDPLVRAVEDCSLSFKDTDIKDETIPSITQEESSPPSHLPLVPVYRKNFLTTCTT